MGINGLDLNTKALLFLLTLGHNTIMMKVYDQGVLPYVEYHDVDGEIEFIIHNGQFLEYGEQGFTVDLSSVQTTRLAAKGACVWSCIAGEYGEFPCNLHNYKLLRNVWMHARSLPTK